MWTDFNTDLAIVNPLHYFVLKILQLNYEYFYYSQLLMFCGFVTSCTCKPDSGLY